MISPKSKQAVMEGVRWEKSGCPYCGVGCGLTVGIRDGALVKIKGDPNHPANFGEICAKAAHLIPTVQPADRALFPMVRDKRGGGLQRASWPGALSHVARHFKRIIAAHGADAVGFYGSGQLMTESYYLFNKLAKGFIGTNNFDTNSRLCMASAASAYAAAFGSDGPPVSYEDLELADLFFVVGSNTAWCHPITFRRLEKRKQRASDEVRVIVVDPRRTETADLADLHLALRPGSDLALLNAMLGIMIRERLIDEQFIADHTRDWELTRKVALGWTPERAATACGVAARDIVHAGKWFGRSARPLSLWSMGVNQSTEGTAKALGIINLHLAAGKIGKPGCGPFSLTGQPNAMGGREVGGLSHLLPGYRSVDNPNHRKEVAAHWKIPAERISPAPGLSAVELFEGLAAGRVKAVWIICSNPAVSMPDLDLVDRALRYAELVVVQDSFHPTDTSLYADVVLPAAQWPEKEGVMTNSERRITLLPKLIEPPGEALDDWEIAALFGRLMGFSEAFTFANSESVFEEYKSLTAGTPIDITGLTYQRLENGPVLWPCPAGQSSESTRLYGSFNFNWPDGRARFHATEHRGPAETPDSAFPLILTTGRVRNQWHTMTRTGKAPALMKAAPEPYVEIHPDDAAVSAITDGCFVEVRSRRGIFVAQARVTAEIVRGTCFVPFHWGRMSGAFKAINNLTHRACDPVSKQAELKFCAVNVRPVVSWNERESGVAMEDSNQQRNMV
jgi:anaerobic selenocysteine-containing dehydrogenase